MYKNIVVATDGSAMAAKAVATAAALASQNDSVLTVVHVKLHGEPSESLKHMAEVEHLVSEAPGKGAAQNDEILAAVGDTVVNLATVTAREAGVTSVNSEILEGGVADGIAGTAARVGADLIVVGNRGLNRVEQLVMGSVSQEVSRKADCACLIVK